MPFTLATLTSFADLETLGAAEALYAIASLPGMRCRSGTTLQAETLERLTIVREESAGGGAASGSVTLATVPTSKLSATRG
jgi:hypothetical protein